MTFIFNKFIFTINYIPSLNSLAHDLEGIVEVLLEEIDDFFFPVELLEDFKGHEEGHDEAVILSIRQTNHHEGVTWPDVQVVLLYQELYTHF